MIFEPLRAHTIHNLPFKAEFYSTQTCQKAGFLFKGPILVFLDVGLNAGIPMYFVIILLRLLTSVKNSQPKRIEESGRWPQKIFGVHEDFFGKAI